MIMEVIGCNWYIIESSAFVYFFQFSQNEDLKEQLFSTFPKTLVEASPLDNIWGIGLARDDRRAWNKLSWKGQNLLGEILTTVRDKLMKSFLEPVVLEKTEGDPIQESE